MFTSFSTALSALDATSTAIDVVGNNLANLNTPGFKDSTTYFRDLVTESLGAGLGETQVGFGTGTPITMRQFTQGAIQSSSGVLDAAISGDGFFVVDNAQGNQLYTRAGSFQVDLAGTLRTNTGEAVQGWTVVDASTGAVNTNLAISNISVPVGGVKHPGRGHLGSGVCGRHSRRPSGHRHRLQSLQHRYPLRLRPGLRRCAHPALSRAESLPRLPRSVGPGLPGVEHHLLHSTHDGA